MRFQRQISLFLIVLGLLIAIGTGVYAHRIHNASSIDLKFTSNPTISCNIDGYVFTHTRETYSDGVIYTDGWWRNPQDPSVSMSAEAHGVGWAHILFYGNIDGSSHGDAKNTTSEQLGSWVGFAPLGVGANTHPISAGFTDEFNRSYKTYRWNASGSIKLVPWYWKWRLSGIMPGGSWEPAPSDFHTTQQASTSGAWIVEQNWTTLRRSSPGSSSSSSSSTGSSNTGSSNTGSSNTGSSNTGSSNTGGSSSPSCSQSWFEDYCDDLGSCTVGSGSGVPGPQCGENHCCCP